MNKIEDIATLNLHIEPHFDVEDIKQICFHMNVDYQNLESTSKRGMLRELVKYSNRHRIADRLLKAIHEVNPSLDLSHWGGSLPNESIQAILCEIFNKSYSLSDIKHVAFGLEEIVKFDFDGEMAHMGKSTAATYLVDTVFNLGKGQLLIDEVQHSRPNAYQMYLPRLSKATKAYNKKNQVAQANNETRRPVQQEPVPTQKKTDPAKFISAAILAMRMYADGLNDGGKLAKTTLEMISEND